MNHLQNKLVTESEPDFSKGVLDNINMDSYRLQLEATTNIAMEKGEELQPIPTEMKGGVSDPETDQLSNIIQTFNDRYGTEFEDMDKVRQMAESIVNEVAKNKDMLNSIEHSDEQNARITSDKIAHDELLKHVSTNFNFYKLINDNVEAKEEFNTMVFNMVKGIFNKAV